MLKCKEWSVANLNIKGGSERWKALRGMKRWSGWRKETVPQGECSWHRRMAGAVEIAWISSRRKDNVQIIITKSKRLQMSLMLCRRIWSGTRFFVKWSKWSGIWSAWWCGIAVNRECYEMRRQEVIVQEKINNIHSRLTTETKTNCNVIAWYDFYWKYCWVHYWNRKNMKLVIWMREQQSKWRDILFNPSSNVCVCDFCDDSNLVYEYDADVYTIWTQKY